MSDQKRYVAIIKEADGIRSTFVFDGNLTLDEVFGKINAHHIWPAIKAISVYRDESLEPSVWPSEAAEGAPAPAET
jgi:hypothetical protein